METVKNILTFLIVFFAVIVMVTSMVSAEERRVDVDYLYGVTIMERVPARRWIAPPGDDQEWKEIRTYRVIRSEDPGLMPGHIITRWYPK